MLPKYWPFSIILQFSKCRIWQPIISPYIVSSLNSTVAPRVVIWFVFTNHNFVFKQGEKLSTFREIMSVILVRRIHQNCKRNGLSRMTVCFCGVRRWLMIDVKSNCAFWVAQNALICLQFFLRWSCDPPTDKMRWERKKLNRNQSTTKGKFNDVHQFSVLRV